MFALHKMMIIKLSNIRIWQKEKKPVFSVLLLSLLLYGCPSKFPEDLSLIKIQVIDEQEQAEIPAPPETGTVKMIDPYTDYLKKLLNQKGDNPVYPSDMDAYFNNNKTNQALRSAKPHKKMLKVEFSSKLNLAEYTRGKSYTLINTPYFCDGSKPNALLGWPHVYSEGLNLSFPLHYSIEPREGLSYIYYVFLYLENSYSGSTSHENFNLQANPEDICLQLKGGSMGVGFESNVIIIPENEIIRLTEGLTK